MLLSNKGALVCHYKSGAPMFFSQNITSAHASWHIGAPKALQRARVHNLKFPTSFKTLKIPYYFNKIKKYNFARDKHRALVHLNQKMSTDALYHR